jgi:protoporphyrinogen/coproporphyrinogen III oxidase
MFHVEHSGLFHVEHMVRKNPIRIAIIGGGLAGVTAAWELARSEAPVDVTLFEASTRLGGIVETVHEHGFVIECGPDGWVSEKPWARQLLEALGLAHELLPSNDKTRKIHILKDKSLIAMPNGMRMMVPGDLAALEASPLFSERAKQAFRNEVGRADELKAAAPSDDESVASFVLRHFGDEVLETVGAPLLSGVFGGDVATLSVRAVMAPFVAMEREYGSLITAVQARVRVGATPVFTTLMDGLGTLIDAMAAAIPASWVQLETPVTSLRRSPSGWMVQSAFGEEAFDIVLMAAPVHIARELLRDTDEEAAKLMRMDASSAVVVAFGFDQPMKLPPGFGFLVPPTEGVNDSLLAATFVDQKFEGRVPEGGRLIRAFFGGKTGARLLGASDDSIIALARTQLAEILGSMPEPVVTVLRRWPRSLPQYSVGHLERMAALEERVRAIGNLWLLGNGYRGVGLPDLIRDARVAGRECVGD